MATLALPAAASDLEHPPEKVRSFKNFKACVAALQSEFLKDQKTPAMQTSASVEGSTKTIVADTRHSQGVKVSGRNRAEYRVSFGRTITHMDATGRILGGGQSGSGIDWTCIGKRLFKGGGRSAYIPFPEAPPPAPLPPTPYRS